MFWILLNRNYGNIIGVMSMEEEIVKKLEKLPEKEILGYAIASEEDAKQFYLKLNHEGIL